MNIKFYRLAGTCLLFLLLVCSRSALKAQFNKTHWATDGYQYYKTDADQLVELDTRDSAKKTVLLTKEMLTPAGKPALRVENFFISDDGQKILIFTNSKRVWRYNTRGD